MPCEHLDDVGEDDRETNRNNVLVNSDSARRKRLTSDYIYGNSNRQNLGNDMDIIKIGPVEHLTFDSRSCEYGSAPCQCPGNGGEGLGDKLASLSLPAHAYVALVAVLSILAVTCWSSRASMKAWFRS